MVEQHATPERKRQESRRIPGETYDTALRYYGNIGRGLFALDALLIKMYQEELRRHQAANVGGQVMYAQAIEQRDKVAFNVAPAAIADTEATDIAPVAPEIADDIGDAASALAAEARRAVQEALQGASVADQRSVTLAA